MKPFSYQRATSVAEAVSILGEPAGATVLAGGTNLVDLMKIGVAEADRLLDVTALPFDGIEATPDGGVVIGAGVRNSDLAADPLVRERYPVLSQALLAGASGQLRNMATVGGNLLQRTRCLYFQDPSKPCNKREPGSGCPARAGYHRDLAVLGASASCIATNPSDMCVALALLDAVITLHSTGAVRSVGCAEFFRLPGDAPDRDTNRRPDELITEVRLPPPRAGRSSYRKVRDRASFAFALASIGAVVAVQDGRIQQARLAFGGLAHAPWRARVAEAALAGQPATAQHFEAALQAELGAAEPLPGNAFKVPLAHRLAVRTLSELAA